MAGTAKVPVSNLTKDLFSNGNLFFHLKLSSSYFSANVLSA